MANHPLFVRISDCPLFELLHRLECAFNARIHSLEVILIEVDLTDIEREMQIRIPEIVSVKTLPVRAHARTIAMPKEARNAEAGFRSRDATTKLSRG
jgi:hypothetical protein